MGAAGMRILLAPLAEFTDAPFRRLCAEGGADMTYTEMVSAAALFHGHRPTRHLMETMPGEGRVACQLFGADEEEMAFAAREADALRDGGRPRFCELNLNAGCPMPRIMRSGAGARLAADPERVYRLLKAMVGSTSLPVTLKTRLGPHTGDNRIFELADAAERSGACGLIVHARYTSQMHGGPVHLEVLSELVTRTRLKVVGNGSILDETDVAAMEQAGVDAVMVGRAALRDPAVFARLKRAKPPFDPPEAVERHLRYLVEFRRALAERFPEDAVLDEDAFISLKARTHLFRYFAGVPGAAALRKRFNAVRTLAETRELLAAAFSVTGG